MDQIARHTPIPEPHREVVAMCVRLSLNVLNPNLDGWRVLAGGTGFNLEFQIIHDDPRPGENGVGVIVRFPSLEVATRLQSAKDAGARMLITAEKFAGLEPGPHEFQTLADLEARIARLLPALTQKIQALQERPEAIREGLRRALGNQ